MRQRESKREGAPGDVHAGRRRRLAFCESRRGVMGFTSMARHFVVQNKLRHFLELESATISGAEKSEGEQSRHAISVQQQFPRGSMHGNGNGRMIKAAALSWLLVLCLTVTGQAADDPEIAVEAGAKEIFIGESVDYFVEISNAKNPPVPDMSGMREMFDVTVNGDESRNQTSTFIINGRRTDQERYSHIYRFRLTPKRTGELQVPGPSVTIDGRTISARAIALKVIAPDEQDLVIPELTTSRAKVYPTQPFEVALRILVRPLPNNSDRDPLTPLRQRPPHIEVNWVDPPAGLAVEEKRHWLEEILSENGSGFTLNEITMRSSSIFDGPRSATFNLYKNREKRDGLDGQPVNYFVYELKRRLTPEKAGEYLLGPAIIKGSFVDGIEGRNYSARRLVAIAPAITVEVLDVPEPRPPTYCGGIGMYSVAASASPTTLRVGDPLTLTLDIERIPGSGSLELISAPDFAAHPKFSDDFDVIDRNPTGRIEGDVKRFAYALRPRRAGVEIPALSITVFNPDAEEFSAITTRPIALSVSEVNRVGAGDLVGSVSAAGTPEIKSREQGIYQNITDLGEMRDERVNVKALAGTAVAIWCAVGCLFAGVTSYRRRSGDLVRQRKQQARGAANRRLADARQALAAGHVPEALRIVRSAVVGFIADKLNIVAEGLTASEADASLAETTVPAEDRGAIFRLLESIESAEYGSGATRDVSAMVDTAGELLPRLGRYLDRGS